MSNFKFSMWEFSNILWPQCLTQCFNICFRKSPRLLCVQYILGHWCVFARGYTMSAWTCRCALLSSLYLPLLSGTLVSTFEVTLLHTNDNHARIEETSEDSGKCSASGPCFAGVARRFTKVSEIRKKEKNVLFLDAGDQFQGTVWFNYYKGAEAAHFMNKLGYDAMVNIFIYLFFFMCDEAAKYGWFFKRNCYNFIIIAFIFD